MCSRLDAILSDHHTTTASHETQTAIDQLNDIIQATEHIPRESNDINQSLLAEDSTNISSVLSLTETVGTYFTSHSTEKGIVESF